MACTPTPTQTLFEVVTTTTVTTTTVEVLTTIPPELTTTFTTFCGLSTIDANGTTTCAVTESSEVVRTVHTEEVATMDSQVVLQIPVITSTPTATLFSTCPTNVSTPPSNPPTSLEINSTSIIVSSSSSTLPDGSVTVTLVTATTVVPTWALIPTDVGDHHSEAPRELGPIVGSTLGGFLGMVLIVLLGWSIWRKRDSIRAMHLRDQMWGNEHSALYGRRPKIDSVIDVEEPEPKPYEYGLVGRKERSPSRRSSPDPSPAPTRPQSLAHAGVSPGPYSATFPPTPYLPGSTPGPYDPNAAFLPPTPNPNTPQQTTAAYSSIPTSSPLLPAAVPPVHAHRPSESVTSIGTAVSYPYQVPVPVLSRELQGGDEHEDPGPAADRRPKRMSLKLANWNPETDGELFPRASLDNERPESIRHR